MLNKVLAIIPARSGSKSIPNKNIYPICGMPLIEYTCAFAKECLDNRIFDNVIVSTDSEHYLSITSKYNFQPGYLRHEDISHDNSPTIDAVIDVIKWFKDKHDLLYDIIVILQPTSPFRKIHDVLFSINKLQSSPDISSVVGVSPLSDHHPIRIKKIDDNGILRPFCDELHESEFSRRQDYKPIAYIRNGSFYISRTSTILNDNVIRGNSVYGHICDDEFSVNIDDPLDLFTAEAVLRSELYSDSLSFYKRLLKS